MSEKITYYYSQFDLFNEKSTFIFLKYQFFKNMLKMSLGFYNKKLNIIEIIHKKKRKMNIIMFEKIKNKFSLRATKYSTFPI